jgi:hypothetical protein
LPEFLKKSLLGLPDFLSDTYITGFIVWVVIGTVTGFVVVFVVGTAVGFTVGFVAGTVDVPAAPLEKTFVNAG